MKLQLRLSFPAAVLLGSLVVGCSGSAAGSGPDAGADPVGSAQDEPTVDDAEEPEFGSTFADAELDATHRELLRIAFSTVDDMPLEPHVKNRSRIQESVVEACLELGQIATAYEFTEQIANWRRGAQFAEIAYHLAEQGELADVNELLQRAFVVATEDESALSQDWRRDNIRVRIARVHALLGQDAEAQVLEAGVVDSESFKVVSAHPNFADPEQLEPRLEGLRQIAENGVLDQARNVVEATVELYRAFYADDERRAQIERTLVEVCRFLPQDIGIEVRAQLAEVAIENADFPRALTFVDEAAAVVDGERWLPEDELPLRARLASLRYRAGADEQGLLEAFTAREFFDANRGAIYDVFRGEALRPLAEAFVEMGMRDTAAEVYALAVEEGVENPNSRPRAEDLAATCISMALHGFEPEQALLERLREIERGLGDPW